MKTTEELQKYIVFYKYAYDKNDIDSIMMEICKESPDEMKIFYKGLILAGMPDGSEFFKGNWWLSADQIRAAIANVSDYYTNQYNLNNKHHYIMSTDEVNVMAKWVDETRLDLANKKLFAKPEDQPEIKRLEQEVDEKEKIVNEELDAMEKELKERAHVDEQLWVIYRALNKRSFVVE